jgi:hypothetical protein
MIEKRQPLAIEQSRSLPQELVRHRTAAWTTGLPPRKFNGEEVEPAMRRGGRGNRQERRQHRLVCGAGLGLLDGRGISRA